MVADQGGTITASTSLTMKKIVSTSDSTNATLGAMKLFLARVVVEKLTLHATIVAKEDPT